MKTIAASGGPGLIIFDCDGVLVDSEPIVNRVEAEFLSEKGWPLSPSEARAAFKGRTVAEVVALIRTRTSLTDVDCHDLALRTAYALVTDLAPVPGVLALLDMLDGRGIPICVASQSPFPRVRLSLHTCGLERFFGSRVFTSSMVARPKPAPDLFLHAATHLGVGPGECVVIEDSPSGVAAAVAAGMTALGYAADESAERLEAAGATTFATMAQVAGLLGLA